MKPAADPKSIIAKTPPYKCISNINHRKYQGYPSRIDSTTQTRSPYTHGGAELRAFAKPSNDIFAVNIGTIQMEKDLSNPK